MRDNDVNLCACEFRCILAQTRGVAFPLILYFVPWGAVFLHPRSLGAQDRPQQAIVVLCGATGTGKTMVLNAFANSCELLQPFGSFRRYSEVRRFFVKLGARIPDHYNFFPLFHITSHTTSHSSPLIGGRWGEGERRGGRGISNCTEQDC